MKDKLIIFIIGVLVGAIISTGIFYVYTKTNNNNNNQQMQFPGGNPPSMPNGDNSEPPSRPDRNNMTNNSQTNSN